MILGEIGINLGPLIAGAGIIGVALGFGSQSLVKDFLSGVFILVEDQFGVGDIVDLDGQTSGTVDAVSLRTTRLRSVDGTLWHVPNGEIRRVGNKSQHWSRALIDIEVAYDTDLDHAEAVIARVADEIATGDADVIEQPEVWGVEQLGANGIVIRLVVKTRPSEQFRVSPRAAPPDQGRLRGRGHRDPVPAADRLAPADAGRRQRRSELIRDGELDRAIELDRLQQVAVVGDEQERALVGVQR